MFSTVSLMIVTHSISSDSEITSGGANLEMKNKLSLGASGLVHIFRALQTKFPERSEKKVLWGKYLWGAKSYILCDNFHEERKNIDSILINCCQIMVIDQDKT